MRNVIPRGAAPKESPRAEWTPLSPLSPLVTSPLKTSVKGGGKPLFSVPKTTYGGTLTAAHVFTYALCAVSSKYFRKRVFFLASGATLCPTRSGARPTRARNTCLQKYSAAVAHESRRLDVDPKGRSCDGWRAFFVSRHSERNEVERRIPSQRIASTKPRSHAPKTMYGGFFVAFGSSE